MLMEAVDNNKLDLIDFLLARARSLGIDVTHTDKEGNNILYYAAANGSLPVFRKLLGAGCSLDSDNNNRNLLMQTALHGHLGLAEFLVNNSELLRVDLTQKDREGRNVLFYW